MAAGPQIRCAKARCLSVTALLHKQHWPGLVMLRGQRVLCVSRSRRLGSRHCLYRQCNVCYEPSPSLGHLDVAVLRVLAGQLPSTIGAPTKLHAARALAEHRTQAIVRQFNAAIR